MVAISVVIPCYNEEESVSELAKNIISILDGLGRGFEIIFVDDGSTDGTFVQLTRLHAMDERIKVVKFRSNFGKSAALQAGFSESKGRVIITMDADLQDDPRGIPSLLTKLKEGNDLVSGWKKERKDPIRKRMASKVFNKVTALMTRVPLHDFNCGIKAYNREVLEEIELYGEMHRYIPVFAHRKGFKVAEIPVRHHPRKHGKSKYGFERFLRGGTDLLTILFLTKYLKRPAHFFGGLGVLTSLGGIGISIYLTVLWFLGQRPIGNRPLFFLGILLIITGLQIFSMGLIGEMLTKAGAKQDQEYSVETRLV